MGIRDGARENRLDFKKNITNNYSRPRLRIDGVITKLIGGEGGFRAEFIETGRGNDGICTETAFDELPLNEEEVLMSKVTQDLEGVFPKADEFDHSSLCMKSI